MNCYLQVFGRNWTQEHYDTMSGDARRRASQLRKVGFKATCCSLGMQVTNVGRVRMTMVDIRPGTTVVSQDTTVLPTEDFNLISL